MITDNLTKLVQDSFITSSIWLRSLELWSKRPENRKVKNFLYIGTYKYKTIKNWVWVFFLLRLLLFGGIELYMWMCVCTDIHFTLGAKWFKAFWLFNSIHYNMDKLITWSLPNYLVIKHIFGDPNNFSHFPPTVHILPLYPTWLWVVFISRLLV